MKSNFNSYRVAKTACITFTVLSMILLAWMFASWVDIVSDNLSNAPQIESWNFFPIAVKIFG